MKTIHTFKLLFNDWLKANYGDTPNKAQRHMAEQEFTKLINYLIHIGAIK
jgi:GrpB-like predicted nucleotidyltransferase (UPF0157 family)